jgi:hypothetical protein
MNLSVSPLDSLPFFPLSRSHSRLGFLKCWEEKIVKRVVHTGMHIQTH